MTFPPQTHVNDTFIGTAPEVQQSDYCNVIASEGDSYAPLFIKAAVVAGIVMLSALLCFYRKFKHQTPNGSVLLNIGITL